MAIGDLKEKVTVLLEGTREQPGDNKISFDEWKSNKITQVMQAELDAPGASTEQVIREGFLEVVYGHPGAFVTDDDKLWTVFRGFVAKKLNNNVPRSITAYEDAISFRKDHAAELANMIADIRELKSKGKAEIDLPLYSKYFPAQSFEKPEAQLTKLADMINEAYAQELKFNSTAWRAINLVANALEPPPDHPIHGIIDKMDKRINPPATEAELAAYRAAMEKKDYDQAYVELKKVYNNHKFDLPVVLALANLCHDLNRFDEAYNLYSTYRRTNKQDERPAEYAANMKRAYDEKDTAYFKGYGKANDLLDEQLQVGKKGETPNDKIIELVKRAQSPTFTMHVRINMDGGVVQVSLEGFKDSTSSGAEAEILKILKALKFPTPLNPGNMALQFNGVPAEAPATPPAATPPAATAGNAAEGAADARSAAQIQQIIRLKNPNLQKIYDDFLNKLHLDDLKGKLVVIVQIQDKRPKPGGIALDTSKMSGFVTANNRDTFKIDIKMEVENWVFDVPDGTQLEIPFYFSIEN